MRNPDLPQDITAFLEDEVRTAQAEVSTELKEIEQEIRAYGESE